MWYSIFLLHYDFFNITVWPLLLGRTQFHEVSPYRLVLFMYCYFFLFLSRNCWYLYNISTSLLFYILYKFHESYDRPYTVYDILTKLLLLVLLKLTYKVDFGKSRDLLGYFIHNNNDSRTSTLLTPFLCNPLNEIHMWSRFLYWGSWCENH